MEQNDTATAYTAGPWKVVAEPWLFNGTPTICTATDGGMILGTVTHREGNYEGQLGDPVADARLMAAAPELLDACRFALDRLHDFPALDDEWLSERLHCVTAVLDKAIVKAAGAV